MTNERVRYTLSVRPHSEHFCERATKERTELCSPFPIRHSLSLSLPPPLSIQTIVALSLNFLSSCPQNSRITIEDFHREIPVVTSYPLRPYVVPFLRLHLPILQTELSRLYSASQAHAQGQEGCPQVQTRVGGRDEDTVHSFKGSDRSSLVRSLSNFVRLHESLFLQSVPQQTAINSPIVNQSTASKRPLINQPHINTSPQVNQTLSRQLVNGNTFGSHPSDRKFIQIGNNFYFRRERINEPFEIFQPIPTAPKLIQAPPLSTSLVSHQVINHPVINKMGVKDETMVMRTGIKRKLNSPIDSRKENQIQFNSGKPDISTKSDHLRVSSGPRKVPSPQNRVNCFETRTSSPSTIHYLPQSKQCTSSLINSQLRSLSHENVSKRMKPNESCQVSPPIELNVQINNNQVLNESSETDEEWDNIYVVSIFN